jgi:DNA-binding response OmpR family regulator
MKKRVLIVEDDIDFASLIHDFLEAEDYIPHTISKCEDALSAIKNFNPDMILMDRNLNGMDGIDIIKEIRTNKNMIPVIFMTSLTEDLKVVDGLMLHNCEYLKKPFGLNELKLRIERHFQFSESSYHFCLEKYFWPQQFVLKNGDRLISLTKCENTLLSFLFENQERICTLESIISIVWGDKNIEYLNRVDVLIKKLRDKLNGLPFIIENHKGVGYTLKSIALNIKTLSE